MLTAAPAPYERPGTEADATQVPLEVLEYCPPRSRPRPTLTDVVAEDGLKSTDVFALVRPRLSPPPPKAPTMRPPPLSATELEMALNVLREVSILFTTLGVFGM